MPKRDKRSDTLTPKSQMNRSAQLRSINRLYRSNSDSNFIEDASARRVKKHGTGGSIVDMVSDHVRAMRQIHDKNKTKQIHGQRKKKQSKKAQIRVAERLAKPAWLGLSSRNLSAAKEYAYII